VIVSAYQEELTWHVHSRNQFHLHEDLTGKKIQTQIKETSILFLISFTLKEQLKYAAQNNKGVYDFAPDTKPASWLR